MNEPDTREIMHHLAGLFPGKTTPEIVRAWAKSLDRFDDREWVIAHLEDFAGANTFPELAKFNAFIASAESRLRDGAVDAQKRRSELILQQSKREAERAAQGEHASAWRADIERTVNTLDDATLAQVKAEVLAEADGFWVSHFKRTLGGDPRRPGELQLRIYKRITGAA